MTKDDMIRLIFEAARSHGEQSDPEMEIGDLQNVLIAVFEQLTTEQAATIFHDNSFCGFVRDWFSEDQIRVLLALGAPEILHMRFGSRYKYNYGVSIDELRHKNSFLISMAGRPSKTVGVSSTIVEARRLAYNWLVSNNVIEEDGDGASNRS